MTKYRWLTHDMVNAFHEAQISEHGGSPGIRDEGLLTSALARPRNLAAYGDPSLAELAAGYAFGIAKNHPFVDGNKRAAFMAAFVFLGLNGHRLVAPEVEAVAVFRDLAAGALDEAMLATWIERHLEPVGR